MSFERDTVGIAAAGLAARRPGRPRRGNRLRLRLTVEVEYSLNGEDPREMETRLRRMAEHGAGNGAFTGDSAAEVDLYKVRVERL